MNPDAWSSRFNHVCVSPATLKSLMLLNLSVSRLLVATPRLDHGPGGFSLDGGRTETWVFGGIDVDTCMP